MSSDPTREEVKASITPRSDQINADDLITGPVTVTIKKVRRGDKEQPIIIDLLDHDRSYRPCKSMRRVLIAVFSDDPKQWLGQQATLFCDPNVMWGGVKVGGIRISHLSGIQQPRTIMLTASRGKRAEFTIRPIPAAQPVAPTLEDVAQSMARIARVGLISVAPTPEDEATIADATGMLNGAHTLAELQEYGKVLAIQTAAVQDAMRPIYRQRKNELENADT